MKKTRSNLESHHVPKSEPSRIDITLAEQNRNLPADFVFLAEVDSTIQQDVRYAGNNNFIGRPIKGYDKATVILTNKAAQALSEVQKAIKRDSKEQLSLLVYDGYRPQRAVDDFYRWSQDMNDQAMKDSFYPNIEKGSLFEKGYIARTSGHSRGSTIDLTIVSLNENKFTPLDMGSTFDMFDSISNYATDKISTLAQQNRKYLRDMMIKHGFKPYDKEWWHFTLHDEPFPEIYFDFPIK